MDKNAVWHARDEDLRDLGLVFKGDIVMLKVFCGKEIDTGDKRTLASIIKGTSTERVVMNPKRSKTLNRLSYKSVSLGWMNFEKQQNKYIAIRTSKGGGIRVENFPNDADANMLLDKMKDLFFVNGKSCFGKVSNFRFCLGNFKGDRILDESSFHLANYIKLHKLSKTRLYLLSKEIGFLEQMKTYDSDEDLGDSKFVFVAVCCVSCCVFYHTYNL